MTDVGWVPPRVLTVALTEAFGVRRATAALTSLDVHGSATVPMRTLRAADQACATLRAWSLLVRLEARP